MTNKNKNKPVIEDVKISKEKMEELEAELNTSRKSTKSKQWVIRVLIGGNCSCGGIPGKKVVYDIGDGSTLIEFYCDSSLRSIRCARS